MIVLKRQFSSVQFGYGGHKAEAEAATWCRAASLQTVKAAQHRLTLILGNTRTIIRDTKHRPSRIVGTAQTVPCCRLVQELCSIPDTKR